MLLKSVEYVRPDSVAQAIEILESNEGAALLAGGQSLVNILKHRVASVDVLVDIASLEELRFIETHPDGSIEIGACVTYDELDHSEVVRSNHEMIAWVASHIEDQQIRNRGTIGGNCCLSDPTNNLPPLLVSMDATMNIQSSKGMRQVRAEEFFKGYLMTAVQPGEILKSITVPRVPSDVGIGYVSLSVGEDSKAIVRSSAWVQLNDVIQDARVVLARVAPVPVRYQPMEEALRGSSATPEDIARAASLIGSDFEPVADSHGSSEYRREMAQVVAKRAVLEAVDKVRGEGGSK